MKYVVIFILDQCGCKQFYIIDILCYDSYHVVFKIEHKICIASGWIPIEKLWVSASF
jgi:hypothetical protein